MEQRRPTAPSCRSRKAPSLVLQPSFTAATNDPSSCCSAESGGRCSGTAASSPAISSAESNKRIYIRHLNAVSPLKEQKRRGGDSNRSDGRGRPVEPFRPRPRPRAGGDCGLNEYVAAECYGVSEDLVSSPCITAAPRVFAVVSTVGYLLW
jgi:hypothetical protein